MIAKLRRTRTRDGVTYADWNISGRFIVTAIGYDRDQIKKVTLEICAPENLEFNHRENLVSANRVSWFGKPYARPGEAIVTANVGAWYSTACYWREQTEKAEEYLEDLLPLARAGGLGSTFEIRLLEKVKLDASLLLGM